MIGKTICSQVLSRVLWPPPSPSSGLSRIAGASVLQNNSLPVPVELLCMAPALPSLCRVSWWPYMPRLPRRRPYGGQALHLPCTSNLHIPEGCVGGNPSGGLIPGGPPAVCRTAPTPDWHWFISFLTSTPDGKPSDFFTFPLSFPSHFISIRSGK